MKSKILAVLAMSAILSACGGGSGGNSTPGAKTSIKGVAIDGYVEGAVAFLDYNHNGIWDEGEPKTTTDQNGRFAFDEVDEVCAIHSPTVVDVPVGAWDSDYGVVSEPYRLTFPPAFSSDNIEGTQTLWATTPFTTFIWNSMRQELQDEGAFDCYQLADNESLKSRITHRVSELEYNIAKRYNIPVGELYDDFIASGNTYQHELAQKLVVGLAKAYEETREFEKLHPNQPIAIVEYYFGNPDNGEVATEWYRREYAAGFDYVWRTLETMNEDLTESTGIVDIFFSETKYENNVMSRYIRGFSKDTYPWGNPGGFICTYSENHLQQNTPVNTPRLSVVASFNERTDIDDWMDCLEAEHSTQVTAIQVATEVLDQYGRFTSAGSFFYNTVSTNDVTVLVEDLVAGHIDAYNALDSLAFHNPDINVTEGYGSAQWVRYQKVYGAGRDYVYTKRESVNPLWFIQHFADNGTYTIECGIKEGEYVPATSEQHCKEMFGLR